MSTIIIFKIGKWQVILAETSFHGPAINHGIPMPASVSKYLSQEDEWIVGVVDRPFLKMVRLRVTGSTRFEWISAKYDINYNASCLTSFSEKCFVGNNATKNSYLIQLVAEPDGIKFN